MKLFRLSGINRKLNVFLLLHSVDYFTHTWWSMKTIKAWVFCDQVPEWRWVHARSIARLILHTQMGIYSYFLHTSYHFVKFTDDLSNSPDYCSLTILSQWFSIRKLEYSFFWLGGFVYIFAYGSKIVHYYFLVNWRNIGYLAGVCQAFSALYQHMSMYHCLRL